MLTRKRPSAPFVVLVFALIGGFGELTPAQPAGVSRFLLDEHPGAQSYENARGAVVFYGRSTLR